MAASAFSISIARRNLSLRSALTLTLTLASSKRLFHSAVSSPLHPTGVVSYMASIMMRRPSMPYSAVRLLAGAGASRLNPIRCIVNRFSDRPPIGTVPLIPGCDFKHWHVVMYQLGEEELGEEDPTKEQMIDCYVKTLAKVLGSEEEAIKKIYSVECERYFAFGCEIDEETSNKLEGLPGVLAVFPDCYDDVENKDYRGELFVNGQIVKRSPERQRRVEPVPQRAQDRRHRPRYTNPFRDMNQIFC